MGVRRKAYDDEYGWWHQALCAGSPDTFFPDRLHGGATKMAKRICDLCVVRARCLSEALELTRGGVRVEGVWGGTTEKERKRLQKMEEKRCYHCKGEGWFHFSNSQPDEICGQCQGHGRVWALEPVGGRPVKVMRGQVDIEGRVAE